MQKPWNEKSMGVIDTRTGIGVIGAAVGDRVGAAVGEKVGAGVETCAVKTGGGVEKDGARVGEKVGAGVEGFAVSGAAGVIPEQQSRVVFSTVGQQ
jgi:hypothetical protein